MSEKAEFAERLKAALLAAGYEARPVVVEKHFNLRYWGRPVTFQAARRWLRGESIPEQDKLVVLAEWLEIDPHTLRFGPPPSSDPRVAEKLSRWDHGLATEDKLLIEAFLTLPPAKRQIVREVVQAFLKAERLSGRKH